MLNASVCNCVDVSISHRHLALVLVLQAEVVSLRQVEMDANQVKQHFTGRTLLEEKEQR